MQGWSPSQIFRISTLFKLISTDNAENIIKNYWPALSKKITGSFFSPFWWNTTIFWVILLKSSQAAVNFQDFSKYTFYKNRGWYELWAFSPKLP